MSPEVCYGAEGVPSQTQTSDSSIVVPLLKLPVHTLHTPEPRFGVIVSGIGEPEHGANGATTACELAYS